MNLSIFYLFAFLGVCLVTFARRAEYLLFIWPVMLLVFPTTRTLVIGAPIYWFDIVTLLLVVRFLTGSAIKSWPRSIPQWHLYFLIIGSFFGTMMPMIYYGLSSKILWIWGHTILAYSAFPIGIVISLSSNRDKYLFFLGLGFSFSAFLLFIVAIIQWGDPVNALKVNAFFHSDLQSEDSLLLRAYRGDYYASRVNGPQGAPTSFGGIAVLVGILVIATLRRYERRISYLAIACASVVLLATVSRHALLAVIVGVVIYLALSNVGGRLKIAIIAPALVALFLVSGFSDGWTERLGRWEGGISQDANVTARVIDGPLRLANLIAEYPIVFLTGVGFDVQKLAKQGVQVADFSQGFVSNSFLLPLYYLGICGFLLFSTFWLWSLKQALSMPGRQRALAVSCTVVIILLILADNYAFMKEPVMAMMLLYSAIQSSERVRMRHPRASFLPIG